jgi:serine/threonine protein kinase
MLTPGTRLGPYEIVAPIGAGGMGEVFRGRDTRLNRNVAIKILPPEFAQNSHWKLRFEREAKAISALTHPHICTLYDVGENYLVMELLEGESLADRLVKGPLPIGDVLRYGEQIAKALDTAHRAGIVHRDLKPGNIMLTKSGAKLLDFGLAKSGVFTAPAESATAQKPLTAEGTIVGTFQYMSPEQLEGAESDPRSDIWALGAVLYEMATGQRAFQGATKTSLIAAIVGGEPKPVAQLQPLTPPALEHVIRKCLSKDRDDRWQSAHDVGEELRWVATSSSEIAAPVATRRKSRERLAWIAALVAISAIAAWLGLRTPPRDVVIQAAIPFDGNSGWEYASGPPALSADGESLVYSATNPAGQRFLWVRSMERGTTQPVPGTLGGTHPFWSPDGRFIGFFADGKLKKIAATGGEAGILASGGWSADWGISDIILYGSPTSGMWRVSAAGGEPSQVIAPASIGAAGILYPDFLPDGNRFLFYAYGGALERRNQRGIWVSSLDRSVTPRFLTHGTTPRYATAGWLLFERANMLRAQRFDLDELRLRGEMKTIAPVQTVTVFNHSVFAASNTGLLVYLPPGAADRSELLIKKRSGEVIRKIGETRAYWGPRLSPDGKRVAVDVSDPRTANGDIWVFSVDTGAGTRVSFDAGNESVPAWSPDGRTIVYHFDQPTPKIFSITLGGSPALLADPPGTIGIATDWSPDGRHLAVSIFSADGDPNVVAWSLTDRKAIDIATTRANETFGVFSPDGKWIAYQSDETGRYEVYVQPFPPTGAKYQVSAAGGSGPKWGRRDEISYINAESRLCAVEVDASSGFRAGKSETLFPFAQRDIMWGEYDVFPDGTYLVNSLVRERPAPMVLIVDWRRRLEAKSAIQ